MFAQIQSDVELGYAVDLHEFHTTACVDGNSIDITTQDQPEFDTQIGITVKSTGSDIDKTISEPADYEQKWYKRHPNLEVTRPVGATEYVFVCVKGTSRNLAYRVQLDYSQLGDVDLLSMTTNEVRDYFDRVEILRWDSIRNAFWQAISWWGWKAYIPYFDIKSVELSTVST